MTQTQPIRVKLSDVNTVPADMVGRTGNQAGQLPDGRVYILFDDTEGTSRPHRDRIGGPYHADEYEVI